MSRSRFFFLANFAACLCAFSVEKPLPYSRSCSFSFSICLVHSLSESCVGERESKQNEANRAEVSRSRPNAIWSLCTGVTTTPTLARTPTTLMQCSALPLSLALSVLVTPTPVPIRTPTANAFPIASYCTSFASINQVIILLCLSRPSLRYQAPLVARPFCCCCAECICICSQQHLTKEKEKEFSSSAAIGDSPTNRMALRLFTSLGIAGLATDSSKKKAKQNKRMVLSRKLRKVRA